MPARRERNILDHVGLFMSICAATALMLFYVQGSWTNSYTFPEYRRSVIFIAAMYMLTVSYINKRRLPLLAFLGVAILYNPLFVGFFSRGWLFLDILSILVFILVR
jgi:hypothetical protein